MTKTFRNLSTTSGGRSFNNTSYSTNASGGISSIFTGGTWTGGTWNNVTIDTAYFRNSVILYGTNSTNSIAFNGQTNYFSIDLPIVNFGTNTKVFYGGSNYITSDADNRLCLIGNNGISLSAITGSISIPLDCQLEYGNSQQYIRGNSANQLVIGAPQISFAGVVDIPYPYSLTFGISSTYIQSMNLAGDTLAISAPIIDLAATGKIGIGSKIPLTFGDRARIVEEKGILSITADTLQISNQTLLKFERGETLVSGNNGLVISAPAFTVTGDLYVKGQTIAVDTINVMVDDPVIIVGEGSHIDNFDRGIAFTVTGDNYGFMGYKSDTGRFVFYSDTNSSFVPNYFPRGTTGLLECSGLYNQQILKVDSPEIVFLSSTIYLNESLSVGISAGSEATLTCTARSIKLNKTTMNALDDGTLSLSGSLLLGSGKLTCVNNVFTMNNVTQLDLPGISAVTFGSGSAKITKTTAGLRISPSLEVGGNITAGVWQASPISPAYGGIGQAFTLDTAIPVYSKNLNVFQQTPNFTYNDTTAVLSIGGSTQLSPTGLTFNSNIFKLGSMTLRGSSFNWSNNDFISSPSLGSLAIQAASSIQLNALNGIDTILPTLKIQKTISINDNAWIQWSSTSIQNVTSNLIFTGKTLSLQCADHVEIADALPVTWGDTKTVGVLGNSKTNVLSLLAGNAISIPTSVPCTFTNSTSQIINQLTELQVVGQTAVRIKAPLIILDGPTQMTGQTSTVQTRTLVVDGSIIKIGDTSLSYDNGKDLGLRLQYFGGSAFMIWQNSSKRFVFASSGFDNDNNDIIEVNTLATLQADKLIINTVPGFTLTGNLIASSCLISGSNFQIGGGSLDNWTTTTTSVITNLNSDYVRGKTVKDFILRDGSQSLINDWNAKSGIIAKYFSFDDPKADAVLVRDINGKISCSGITIDTSRAALCGSVDVSNSTFVLRDEQIDGSKLTGYSAKLSIGGNAKSVTDGIYTTTYDTAHSILKADAAGIPTTCTLPQFSVLGRKDSDVTALSAADVCAIVAMGDNGVKGWEQITNGRPTLTKSTSFIRITQTTSVTLPDGLPGQTVAIVVVIAPETALNLSLNLTTPDGDTGLKTLTFDKSGMSVNLCYFPNLSWVIINSGAICHG